MNKINNKKFIIFFIFLSFISLSIIYIVILTPIYNYKSDRIYNLREVPEKYRVSLLEHFINNRYIENSILILGDSQANGYNQPTEKIYSTLISEKLGKRVINTAIIDGSITDNIYVLNYMIKKNMKFDTIIYNINPAHPKNINHQRLDLKNNIDYRIGILQKSNIFREFSTKFNPKESYIGFSKFPPVPDFFDMPLKSFEIYIDNVEKLILLAKSISKNVIIYETPHASKEGERLNVNIKDKNMLSDRAKYICSKHNIVFLKPKIEEDTFFNDIMHFNEKGHIKMGEILYDTIKNNK